MYTQYLHVCAYIIMYNTYIHTYICTHIVMYNAAPTYTVYSVPTISTHLSYNKLVSLACSN